MEKELKLYNNPSSFDAYYYSFGATKVYPVDAILHAVAKAGKAYHHTEDWSNEMAPYSEHLEGNSPEEWINNAAHRASSSFRKMQSALQEIAKMCSDHLGSDAEAIEWARTIAEQALKED